MICRFVVLLVVLSVLVVVVAETAASTLTRAHIEILAHPDIPLERKEKLLSEYGLEIGKLTSLTFRDLIALNIPVSEVPYLLTGLQKWIESRSYVPQKEMGWIFAAGLIAGFLRQPKLLRAVALLGIYFYYLRHSFGVWLIPVGLWMFLCLVFRECATIMLPFVSMYFTGGALLIVGLFKLFNQAIPVFILDLLWAVCEPPLFVICCFVGFWLGLKLRAVTSMRY